MYKRFFPKIIAALILAVLCVQMPARAQNTDQIFNFSQSFGYSDIYDRNFFGSSVGMSADGSRLIAGGIVSFRQNTGIVRIYKRGATQWEEEAALVPGDLRPEEVFGREVAISRDGSTVLVSSQDPTVVYSYGYLNNAWTQLQTIKLANPNPAVFSNIWSVVLTANGDMALITIRGFDNGRYPHKVLVYSRSGNNWVKQPDLLPVNPLQNETFGYDLTFTADTNKLFVSAANFASDGRVYVFTRSGNSWIQTDVIQKTTTNTAFGSSIAVNGDGTLALIGGREGTIFVYAYSNNTWVQEQSFKADPVSVSETILSEDGDLALIGGDGGVSGEMEFGLAGRVYVYARENGVFVFKQKLERGGSEDNFGTTMALSADEEVAFIGASAFGAPGEDELRQCPYLSECHRSTADYRFYAGGCEDESGYSDA